MKQRWILGVLIATSGLLATLVAEEMTVTSAQGQEQKAEGMLKTKTIEFSADPKIKGREIAEKSYETTRNFGDERVSLQMVLRNADDKTVSRKMKSMTLERENGEDYSMIQFVEPADVRGTGLLTHQDPKGDDKQWLYLPELRRVKRISSSNKSGSFMGSEFAYEDITGNTLDKFAYVFLKEDQLDGKSTYLIEKKPTYDNSGYTKIRTWIDKTTFLALRQEFFDRKETLLKVQTFGEYELFKNKVYRTKSITMDNKQTHKSSELLFLERELGVGLESSDFNQDALKRIR